MSCGCNQPCNCQPRPSVCCTPTTESVEYAFENANLAGIGVFDNDTDNLVQFRGIVSDSAALTVSLDAGNNTVVLSFDSELLVADIPDADTTTRGILETATNAEAIAKAATNKILVPSNFAALGSSETFAGLVELATAAETQAGVSTTLAVHPAGLASAIALSNTVTFAGAVERGNAVPAFIGQFGGQQDTGVGYIGDSLVAGDWNPLFTLDSVNDASQSTVLNFNGNTMQFIGNGTLSISNATFFVTGGDSTFSGATTFFGQNGGDSHIVNLANTLIQIADVAAVAPSILGTTGLSEAMYYEVADFVSVNNVQTGYTPVTNPATIRTFDTATVTLQQLAQAYGTLIEDLKARLLPAT